MASAVKRSRRKRKAPKIPRPLKRDEDAYGRLRDWIEEGELTREEVEEQINTPKEGLTDKQYKLLNQLDDEGIFFEEPEEGEGGEEEEGRFRRAERLTA